MSQPDLTSLLVAAAAGDSHAASELLPLVYRELRALAARRVAAEAAGHTLEPTALVHEAYLRLVDAADPQRWSGRAHFFGAAAEAMRRILVEDARRRGSQKRGGGVRRVGLDEAAQVALPSDPNPAAGASGDDDELIALDEALRDFAVEEPAKARLVELRYFAGLTVAQAAEALGISEATAKRHWVYARSWLYGRVRARCGGIFRTR